MSVYDLEERTYLFAADVRSFLKKLNRTVANSEDSKQLVRSSGSVAANYIEANENLGEKDKLMKLRICKKECKESILWLRLLDVPEMAINEHGQLINEANELLKIFGAIYHKVLSESTRKGLQDA